MIFEVISAIFLCISTTSAESSLPTTTPVPTTTTTVAPSSDPLYKWTGTGKEGTACILLWGKFLFTVNYPKNDSTTGSVNIGVHDVKNTSADCGNKTDSLTVEFFDGWKIAVEFATDAVTSPLLAGDPNANATFWWQQITLQYKYDKTYMPGLDPSSQGKTEKASKTLDHHQFNASLAGFYKCQPPTMIPLSKGLNLTIAEMQYLAFSKNATGFPSGNVTDCSPPTPAAHKPDSIVPIAVGAALAGLVLIVLIAYLIGRARSKKKGYESV